MQILDFPIIKITFFFVFGIIISYYLHIPIGILIGISVFLISILGFLVIKNRKKFRKTVWFGCIAFVTFLILGMLSFQLNHEKNYKSHYTNSVKTLTKSNGLILEVSQILKPTLYQDKYVAELKQIGNKPVTGKLLVNITRDSIKTKLDVGDNIYIRDRLDKVKPPLNPGQFDYRRYLEKQHIYHQVYTEFNEIRHLENQSNSIFTIAYNIRTRIVNNLEETSFKEDQLAIFKALLLGQRTDISKDTYNNYINAGAVHILAVSGLHVGIILLILQFIFKPLDYIKYGRTYRIILILIFLWSFAIIAGLSPSVTRAVAMFTAVTFAINLKSAVNIYNTLAISVLFLLLIKPTFLFDVGFQLSYVAVISIVALRPIFYRQLQFNNKILDYFWQLLCVTLSAQIGVLPIGLYYFHQFPALFFVSNLIIVPILGIILSIGILLIISALIKFVPEVLVKVFGGLIDIMNYVVGWVSSKEAFLFQDIAFSFAQVIISYLIIFSLTKFIVLKRIRYLYGTLTGLFLFQLSMFYYSITPPENFIIYHKTRETYIGRLQNQRLSLFHNYNPEKIESLNVFKNHVVDQNVREIKSDSLKNVLKAKNKYLLIVDSIGIYNTTSFDPSYVLLKDSPKINLNRLIDSIKPEIIIADGSNYKSYVARWKTTAANKKIPFHATAEKGAFILKF